MGRLLIPSDSKENIMLPLSKIFPFFLFPVARKKKTSESQGRPGISQLSRPIFPTIKNSMISWQLFDQETGIEHRPGVKGAQKPHF